jgi:hypothetical protein
MTRRAAANLSTPNASASHSPQSSDRRCVTRPTARDLPTFREAYPIKGQKAKQPYAIAMKDGTPFGIAGIWENWKDPSSGEWTRTFAIITTEANELVADIHDRMPVLDSERPNPPPDRELLINAQIAAPLYGPLTLVVQKIALTARWLWLRNCTRGPAAKPPCIAFTRRCSAPSHPGGGDDRVSGTDAERHDDIYHNDSSGFGGYADRAEMADLGGEFNLDQRRLRRHA